MTDDNSSSTPETESPFPSSGTRWERAAPPDDTPYPAPDTGAYPVAGAPVAKRRRARAAAAIAAAAVVAGFGGFGVGRVTAGDEDAPTNNQVGDTDQDPGRFGGRQLDDGDRPDLPGNGQPPDGFPGQDQDSGQGSAQGSATS